MQRVTDYKATGGRHGRRAGQRAFPAFPAEESACRSRMSRRSYWSRDTGAAGALFRGGGHSAADLVKMGWSTQAKIDANRSSAPRDGGGGRGSWR